MQRNRLITLAGILALTISGCASETPPPVTTAPNPVPASPAPAPSPNAGQISTNQPLAARSAPPTVPGLIPSTNAREREKQIQTEIRTGKSSDPFSALPPQLPNSATGARPVPNVANLPDNRPGGTDGSSQNPGGGNTGRGANQPPRVVAGIPPERTIGDSPTLPQPQEAEDNGVLGTYIPPVIPRPPVLVPPTADAAQAIEVTGVVTVGTTTQAIVQSPDEPSSRYVSVGQRISNGRVLVKRIDMNSGGEPTVIFEQNGVEVAKSVGEKAAPKQA